jgi:hypothetical protein
VRNLVSNAALKSFSGDFSGPISKPGGEAPRVAPGLVVSANDGGVSTQAGPNRALEAFLAQNAARDARRARDEAFLAARSLDGTTELARRRAVAELDLPALSPETALELLNLRLQLLRNLARTPAQRDAAREEIRAIEARYAAILEQQTREQAARLRQVTIELPNQARREALAKIERAAQIEAQNQAQSRRAVAIQSRENWRRDAASTDSLRLALPPVRRASSSPNFTSSGAALPPSRASRVFFETAASPAASNPPLRTKNGVSRTERTFLADRLRAQARADARVWARGGAARLGAVWSQASRPNAKIPDATAQVLQVVSPTVSP